MAKQAQHAGLQLDQHLHFQQVLSVLRMIGALLLLAGLLAALAGVFGNGGPLAQGQASAGDTRAEFPRFARYQAPATLELQLGRAGVSGGQFELVLGGHYASEFAVERITPQPQQVAASGDRIRYTFAAQPGGDQQVRVEGRPEAIGNFPGTATFTGQPPLDIGGFVYP